jgi:hypothetical protein
MNIAKETISANVIDLTDQSVLFGADISSVAGHAQTALELAVVSSGDLLALVGLIVGCALFLTLALYTLIGD